MANISLRELMRVADRGCCGTAVHMPDGTLILQPKGNDAKGGLGQSLASALDKVMDLSVERVMAGSLSQYSHRHADCAEPVLSVHLSAEPGVPGPIMLGDFLRIDWPGDMSAPREVLIEGAADGLPRRAYRTELHGAVPEEERCLPVTHIGALPICNDGGGCTHMLLVRCAA